MSKLETVLVHRSAIDGEPTGSTSTPIYQTATFAVSPQGEWDYTRSGNPTRQVLEQQLARLDGAERCLAYSSGMAAVSAVLRLVDPGSQVLVGSDLYGGTLRFLAELARDRGIEVRLVDTSDIDQVQRQVSSRTALVWLETPSNPRLRSSDITSIADIAHAVGALLAVDNTVLTPLCQRPLGLGADLAVQSATKALGGHSDLTAGVVATSSAELAERLAFRQNAEGNALAPFESWLLLRGIETLSVRLDKQISNSRRVVDFLQSCDAVGRIHSAPNCFVVSFEAGSRERANAFADASRLFRTSVSFGGVASSVNLPCAMSHASVPVEWRGVQKLSPGLVRLSVGIEDPDDLVADLASAIERSAAPGLRAVSR